MNQKWLYVFWGGLYALCAVLGFFPEAGAVGTVLSVVFFLPSVWLLLKAKKASDRNTCALIRNLAALSLGLTLLTLVASMATAVSSRVLGDFLHGVLVVVSSPMICSGYWALSLFLWACLLVAAGKLAGKK